MIKIINLDNFVTTVERSQNENIKFKALYSQFKLWIENQKVSIFLQKESFIIFSCKPDMAKGQIQNLTVQVSLVKSFNLNLAWSFWLN